MDQTGEVINFEVGRAIDALEICVESAIQFAGGNANLDPRGPLVASTICLLREAKTWLELHRTPFEDFAGEPLLQAASRSNGIAVDFFVETVRAAVIELVQVSALVALRGNRLHNPNNSESGEPS